MSMIKALVQFGNWTFDADGWSAETKLEDSRNPFQASATLVERANSYPYLSAGKLTERVIPAWFQCNAPMDAMAGPIDLLMGKLMVDDPTPRRLVGIDADGVRFQIMAVVSPMAGWSAASGGPNRVRLSFTAGSPRWESTTPTDTFGPLMADYGAGHRPALAISNPGSAFVEPFITISPTVAAHRSVGSLTGWKCRRQCTFTNGNRTWENRMLVLDLGDTTAWVTDGAKTDGSDVRVLLNGVALPRSLVQFNWPQSYCIITPPPIAPFETVTFDLVYANASAGSPQVLTGLLHPVPIYESDKGTATGGTNATLVDSTKAWSAGDIDWRGGQVHFLDAPLAPRTRTITSVTATSIGFTPVLPSSTPAGMRYLITLSDNNRWIWNTDDKFLSRNTPCRGRFYASRRNAYPGTISFDVPGAWRLFLMADNTDRKAQLSISRITGAYQALLDARRTWEGGGANGQMTSEDDKADGLMLNSCLPILALHSEVSFTNNVNGMTKVVFMTKADGADAWEEVDAQTGTGNLVLDLATPIGEVNYQIYQGLQAVDENGVIRPDRARDNGSATSDGNTRTSPTDVSGSQNLLKSANATSDPVTDSAGNAIAMPNNVSVERDGRQSGGYRGVIYVDGSGNEYHGWIPLSFFQSGVDAGGTTMNDATKDWVTNQLVGMQFKIISSGRKDLNGKVRIVASNGPGQLTLTTGEQATIVDGTQYELRQKQTRAHVIDSGRTWVDFDTTGITLTPASAKQDVYQLALELRSGDGGEATFQRYARVRVGKDGVNAGDPPLMVFAQPGIESLVLDGPHRRAYIRTDATGAVVQELTDPAVLVQQRDYDPVRKQFVTVRGARWLPMAPGVPADPTPKPPPIIVNRDAGWTIATGAPQSDTTAGSWWSGSESNWLIDITANSGAATSHTDVMLNGYVPVLPSQRVGYVLPVWTNNLALQCRLGIFWYSNTAGAYLGSAFQDVWTFGVANIWQPSSFHAIVLDGGDDFYRPNDTDYRAPAGAKYAKFVLRITDTAGATVGKIRLGSPDRPANGFLYGSPCLWYLETGGVGLNVDVSLSAGILA